MSKWCIQMWTQYTMRLATPKELEELQKTRIKDAKRLFDKIIIGETDTKHWECDCFTQEEEYDHQREGRICDGGLDFNTILRLAAYRVENWRHDEWRILDHETGEEIPLLFMVKT